VGEEDIYKNKREKPVLAFVIRRVCGQTLGRVRVRTDIGQ